MTSTACKTLPFPNRAALNRPPFKPRPVPSVVYRLPWRQPADQKLVERVRREFSDLRGLSLTLAQARRLFDLGHDDCLEIFRQLLQEGFLVLCADDRYRLRPRSLARRAR